MQHTLQCKRWWRRQDRSGAARGSLVAVVRAVRCAAAGGGADAEGKNHGAQGLCVNFGNDSIPLIPLLLHVSLMRLLVSLLLLLMMSEAWRAHHLVKIPTRWINLRLGHGGR